MPVWNPDLPDPLDYPAMWTDVPDNMVLDNGFKAQWELFLRDAALGRPFRWDLFAGARGVQLAELAMRSSAEGVRVEVPPPAGHGTGPDGAGAHGTDTPGSGTSGAGTSGTGTPATGTPAAPASTAGSLT
jgi:hypothetical protein